MSAKKCDAGNVAHFKGSWSVAVLILLRKDWGLEGMNGSLLFFDSLFKWAWQGSAGICKSKEGFSYISSHSISAGNDIPCYFLSVYLLGPLYH